MRRRILLTLLASTSTVLVAFLVPLLVIVGDMAVDRAQRQVVLEIQPLVSRIPVVDSQDLDDLVATFTEQTGRQATIYLPDDTVIGHPQPLDAAVELARDRGAFFTDVSGGRDLLVPVYTADGEAVLRVFVPDEELTAEVPRARVTLVVLGLVLLSLSVGLGLLLARAFLRPTQALSETAERLAAGDLSARVPDSPIPELHTAGTALNRLAARVRELLALEREQVADLAHRLRTPVTALRLDADSLTDTEDAERMHADVAALERMVDEVIREARRPLRESGTAVADLAAVTRERAAFWSVLAEDQQRTMTIAVPDGSVPVRCDARELGDALDALIGNVFTHTPEGVPLLVRAWPTAPHPAGMPGAGSDGQRREAAFAWVEVCDEGPGLPSLDVLRRGSSVAGSTGLGLDIARRVAQRSGGTIEAGPLNGSTAGTRVRLYLARA